ncbi:MAG: hypothetical protein JSW50_02090 [Candidatus Latescibacterota bacterium]|nr:MAG: hypothetical protein JSW50_02090 [Candidatus Latescibacterota bacterium]
MKCIMVLSVVLPFVLYGTSSAGIIDPCKSKCEFYPSVSPTVLFVCPQGDTPSFSDQGWWLSLEIVDFNSNPIADIPAADFWLIDCDPALDLVLCAGSASSSADASTNNQGLTTMSAGTMRAGGCADGLSVVVQGFVLEDESSNCDIYCYPIHVRSPDFDGNLTVDLVDLSLFAQHFPTPYDDCYDLDINGHINLVDVSMFAQHYFHECQ